MERDLQRKYLQLQLMKQQLNGMLEEKALLDEKISEIAATIDAIENLKDVKKDQRIWSPIGSAAFVESDLKDSNKILVGVGAGIIVKKTREGAILTMQERMQELNSIDKEFMTEINKFSEQISVLEPEVQKLAQEEQEKEERNNK